MKTYQRYLFLSCILSLIMVSGVWTVAAEAQYRRPPHQQSFQPSPYIQAGIGGNLNIPIDDTDELLDMSVSLHGTLLFNMDRFLKFEADLGYWFLQAADDEVDDPEDPWLLSLTGGIRYYFNPSFHIDGGLGLYRFSDWDGIIHEEFMRYDDQNELGVYAGVGFEQFPFDVTVRVHHANYYADDFWNISLGVRVFFSPSGLAMQ